MPRVGSHLFRVVDAVDQKKILVMRDCDIDCNLRCNILFTMDELTILKEALRNA